MTFTKYMFVIVITACVMAAQVIAMPPLTGVEPVAPAGVNAPGRAEAMRDDPQLRGDWNSLVILIDFDDYPWDKQDDPNFDNEGLPYNFAHFNEMLFSEDSYQHPGSESEYTGSMRDYYREISNGDFAIGGTITQWWRAPENYSFYCNADGESGTEDDNGYRPYPENVQGLIEAALAALDRNIDYSVFDNDADGFLDALFIVHSGPGAEAVVNEEERAGYFWSHKWQIDDVEYDGITISTYSIEPQDGTIGVFCHEFGHVVGLPDLYDTDGSSEGIGEWGLMSGGGWGHRAGDPAGSSPTHMCGWSKMILNWVSVTDIRNRVENLVISPVANEQTIFRLWVNDQEPEEYFLLENRRRIGFDAGLVRRQIDWDLGASEGLLITHIYEGAGNNRNDSLRWVDVEEASPVFINGNALEHLNGDRVFGDDQNLYHPNRGDNGDLWPGFSELTEDSTDWAGNRDRTHFGNQTIPSSDSNDGIPSLIDVSNIRLDEENIICNITVDPPDAPLLYVNDWIVNDEIDGNGNNIPGAGERVELWMNLRNVGGQNAVNVSATISTESELIEFVEAQVGFNDIPPDNTSRSLTPIIIDISRDTPVPSDIELIATVTADNGYEITFDYTLEIRKQHDWFKYHENPVLTSDQQIISHDIRVEEGLVKCWFVIADLSRDLPGEVAYATSNDGGYTWDNQDQIVMTADPDLAWTERGISSIGIYRTMRQYMMVFTVPEGESGAVIGFATSPDGFEWEIRPEPILRAGNGWVGEITRSGQLGFVESNFGIYVCAFAGKNGRGESIIGCVNNTEPNQFGQWVLWERQILSAVNDRSFFDSGTISSPHLLSAGETKSLLYTGSKFGDNVNRFGEISYGQGFLNRHEGIETGGAILQPGGIGDWGETIFYSGARYFYWQGEKRLSFNGWGNRNGNNPLYAIGIALQEPTLSAPFADDSNPAVASTLLLNPAFPNPFNNTTTINYSIARHGDVSAAIFDLSGREVFSIHNGFQSAGSHSYIWNGVDNHSQNVSSCLYFVRVQAGNSIRSSKIILLK